MLKLVLSMRAIPSLVILAGAIAAVAIPVRAEYLPPVGQEPPEGHSTTTAARGERWLAEYQPPEDQKPPEDDGSTTTA